MAQLTDDCFAFGGELLGVDAALALIDERIGPVVGTHSGAGAAGWRSRAASDRDPQSAE